MNLKLLHNILNRIPMAAITLLVGMLSACSNDIPGLDVTPDAGMDIDVSIRLTAGEQSATRSLLPEEFGTAFENKINLNDLKVLIFDDSGTLKEILYDNAPASETVKLIQTGAVDYVLTAKLDPSLYSTDSRFSVAALVNWRSLDETDEPADLVTGTTKLEDLKEQAYRLNAGMPEFSWTPDDDALIPMFGILYTTLKGYSTDIFNVGNPMDLGTVNLLRSLVKIEIIDRSNISQAEITSIQLNKRNTRGYLLPTLYKNINTNQVTAPTIPAAIGVINPAGYTTASLSFRKEGNKYVAYVPEMVLAEDLNSRLDIVVNIRYNNFDEQRYIAFAPYDDKGSPYKPDGGWPDEWKALLRNHIYRYTINSITVDPNLDLMVDVQPFSNVDLSVDLGLERTEDGYIVVRNSEGKIIKYIRTDGSVLTLQEDDRWPYLGKFMGVFDSTKRVLIGYFEDNRSIIFNYTSDEMDPNNVYKNLESWEIYSRPDLKYSDGKPIPEHLEETFCFIEYKNEAVQDEIVKHQYTHTTLDDKGRVIEEYWYNTLEAFQYHKTNNSEDNRTKLASFTGDRYGDKVITYYKENGDIKCQLIVTGDKEEYIYENFRND